MMYRVKRFFKILSRGIQLIIKMNKYTCDDCTTKETCLNKDIDDFVCELCVMQDFIKKEKNNKD